MHIEILKDVIKGFRVRAVDADGDGLQVGVAGPSRISHGAGVEVRDLMLDRLDRMMQSLMRAVEEDNADSSTSTPCPPSVV